VTQDPNDSAETLRPVRPRNRYCIFPGLKVRVDCDIVGGSLRVGAWGACEVSRCGKRNGKSAEIEKGEYTRAF
jgi:hypothetical protein